MLVSIAAAITGIALYLRSRNRALDLPPKVHDTITAVMQDMQDGGHVMTTTPPGFYTDGRRHLIHDARCWCHWPDTTTH